MVAFVALGWLACAGTASAQAVALRPFAVGTFQRFAAQQTFQAVLGRSEQPFFGGGLNIAFRDGLFIDLTASRFNKTGQRAFLFNGQSFGLGIPLTVTEIPFEVSAGYRFRASHVLRPYVGAGIGSYSYRETASDSSAASDNLGVRHAGYLLVGGVEVRVHSWVAVSADAQWTRVSGILGNGGISKDANERDLGGVAARVRVIVGR